MKDKTADLIGLPLDWAVAECLGATRIQLYQYNGRRMIRVSLPEGIHAPWEPSHYWGQGGPIIERERIETRHDGNKAWCAWKEGAGAVFGPTPLIAAMRCFVSSKLGDEIEIPEELLK
jgi:hypothetical protein